MYILKNKCNVQLNIKINCAIAAPVHRKDLVDGLNSCDKKYLKQIIMIITFPGNEETIGECIKFIPYSV